MKNKLIITKPKPRLPAEIRAILASRVVGRFKSKDPNRSQIKAALKIKQDSYESFCLSGS